MTTAQGVTYRFDVGTIRSGGMMGSDQRSLMPTSTFTTRRGGPLTTAECNGQRARMPRAIS